MSSLSVIEVQHLVKQYGDLLAVRDVSFQVEETEIFGILGPNGSGKTTTVECLQGLRPFDGGSASVLKLDPSTQAEQLRRLIGSQLQESALPDRVKVWEALDLFGSIIPGGPSWESLLVDWGLDSKWKARFGSLSGGQQQRLFVALALVSSPRLVFLDEMTTGLDPAARRVAWDLIRRIRERGTTVVLVTHSMEEAEALCDRVMIMDDGMVVAEGPPSGLVDQFGGAVRITFTLDDDDGSWLADVPHVAGWQRNQNKFEVKGDGPVLTHVAAALLARGHAPTDLRQDRATLEDVFISLTSEGGEL